MAAHRAILILTVFMTSFSAVEWPLVEPFHEERTISLEQPSQDVPALFTIHTDSDVVYRVECHTAEYEGRSPIMYSGTYHCGMFAMKGPEVTSWDLFADDTPAQQGSDW